ncbi:MAG: glycosyltransferase 87 family protein [Acidobacteriota bacterium]
MRSARWWSFPLGLFVAHRLSLMLASLISLSIDPILERPGGIAALHAYPALDALCRWDCGCFAHVAEVGYDAPIQANFWPLFPMLGRVLESAGMPLHFAFLLIANVAGLAAWLVLFRLFSDAEGEAAARWALAVYAAFPFAWFQAAGYPESLMILFTALAVWWARRDEPWAAGAALGVGILARHIAVLAGPALLVAQLRHRGWRALVNVRFLALALPFLVAGVFPLWQWFEFGDPLTFWHVREKWGESAWAGFGRLFQPDTPPQFNSYAWFALVPTLGAIALFSRKRWAELAAYGGFMMVVLWTVGAAGLGRYAASCWPAFLPVGVALERWPSLRLPVLAGLGLAQGMFFNLFAHQYPIL